MFKNRSKDPQLIADLQGSRQREEQALQVIYHQHKGLIEQLILKNGGTPEEAKDIFQDTIIDFYENVKQQKFKGESAIGSYLYSIARFKWLNRLKRKKIESRFVDTQNFRESQESFERKFLAEEEKTQILDLFGQVGSSCRELLIHSIYYQYSMAEIAEKLDYNSEQVVRNQKYRCLKKLKQLLKEQPELFRFLKSDL